MKNSPAICEKLTINGKVRATLCDAKTGRITKRLPWHHNIIPTAGLAGLAGLMGGIGTAVTYGAVGGGTSTPATGDTQMGSEIARKAIATASVNGTTVTIEFFFEAAEGNGAITQCALFGGTASATKDSGTLFEYANFANAFTKAATETLTVECQITFA
jgi:hypothetical protein